MGRLPSVAAVAGDLRGQFVEGVEAALVADASDERYFGWVAWSRKGCAGLPRLEKVRLQDVRIPGGVAECRGAAEVGDGPAAGEFGGVDAARQAQLKSVRNYVQSREAQLAAAPIPEPSAAR